jgi:hypothetical protein
MQRLRRRPSSPRRQLDLGLASLPSSPAIPPSWCALPAPTQRMLTGLLTHLLIAHVGGAVLEIDSRGAGAINER